MHLLYWWWAELGVRVLPKKREIEDSRMHQGKMPGEDVVSA